MNDPLYRQLQRYANRLGLEVAAMEERALEAALQRGECGVLVIRGACQVQAGVHTGVPYGMMHEQVEGGVIPEGEWLTSELINWDPILRFRGVRQVTDDEREAQWKCSVCGQWFVVPSLARLCELKHQKEAT